jgi:hypothetical protein
MRLSTIGPLAANSSFSDVTEVGHPLFFDQMALVPLRKETAKLRRKLGSYRQ